MEKNKKQNKKVQFVVVREFSGDKTNRQPTGNHPGNRPSLSGDPLLRKFQLTAFFFTQFYKSTFVADKFMVLI